MKNTESLQTASMVLAMAMTRIYPDAKLSIGGINEDDGAAYLLPYWMARHLGFVIDVR